MPIQTDYCSLVLALTVCDARQNYNPQLNQSPACSIITICYSEALIDKFTQRFHDSFYSVHDTLMLSVRSSVQPVCHSVYLSVSNKQTNKQTNNEADRRRPISPLFPLNKTN